MNEAFNQKGELSVREDVMRSIRAGKARMKPRWRFALASAAFALALVLAFVIMAYVASLSVFFMRDSGAWYAPSFGERGWLSFARSIPWLCLALVAALVAFMERLACRYAFVYRKPLAYSTAAILLVAVGSGVLVAKTPLHRQLVLSARTNQALGFLSYAYGQPFRSAASSDVYRGRIVALVPRGFVMRDQNGRGTTTVILAPDTELLARAIAVGADVVVIADGVASDTVRAFGMLEDDE